MEDVVDAVSECALELTSALVTLIGPFIVMAAIVCQQMLLSNIL
jgi:hypothetical protein